MMGCCRADRDGRALSARGQWLLRGRNAVGRDRAADVRRPREATPRRRARPTHVTSQHPTHEGAGTPRRRSAGERYFRETPAAARSAHQSCFTAFYRNNNAKLHRTRNGRRRRTTSRTHMITTKGQIRSLRAAPPAPRPHANAPPTTLSSRPSRELSNVSRTVSRTQVTRTSGGGSGRPHLAHTLYTSERRRRSNPCQIMHR